jgi:inosine/xanthosine triphosphate pyrophosphatase family protein
LKNILGATNNFKIITEFFRIFKNYLGFAYQWLKNTKEKKNIMRVDDVFAKHALNEEKCFFFSCKNAMGQTRI